MLVVTLGVASALQHHVPTRVPARTAVRAPHPRLSDTVDVDVAVVGGGPAGYTMAALLKSQHGRNVALVDPNPEGDWPNNYGEWREEWEALSRRLSMPELLSDCVARQWDVTDVFFGGSWGMEWDQRSRLDRAYVQVDRKALKATLTRKLTEGGGDGATAQILASKLQARTVAANIFDDNLLHDATGSTLTLADGTSVRAKLVVDATGFESRLVARESDEIAALWKPLPPGYQIAYGFTCDIEGESLGPYQPEAMTLFDYRTDHLEAAAASGGAAAQAALADAEERPSFMYVMPHGKLEGGGMRAFFEETSLVGKDSRRLEFGTLRDRAMVRLEHLGMKIKPGSIEEEEYCYIPMGGNLPDLTQRVVAFGGAAATVHPSTGYQLCRMLASSTDVASTLDAELSRPDFDPDAAAAAAYAALWPPQLRYQRDFQVFGGEFLGDQKVEYLRGFFDAFFQLEPTVWGGFLAGWPGLPGNEYHEAWNKRLLFGVNLFVKFPPIVALTMMYYAVTFSLEYGPTLLRSFATPLFRGDYPQPLDRRTLRGRLTDTYVTGDVAAKREALSMLAAGNGDPSPQVAAEQEASEQKAEGVAA